MLTKCFIKLAKSKYMIPHMFNVEDMQAYLKATIPPLTSEEYQYFENNEAVKFYETDMTQPVAVCEPRKGEPSLLFHEFVFLLSRIAISKVKTSSTVSGNLNDFFVEKLGFSRVTDLRKARITFEDITRKLSESEGEDYGSEEGDEDEEWESDGMEMDENQRKLMEFLAKKAEEEKDFILDYDTVIAELDSSLPPIPGKPEVEQVNPRPYKLPRILFGKLMPKGDGDDDGGKKKKKAAKKAPARKKDEPPPKPIKWADAPREPPPVTLDLVRKARQDIVENIFPSNIRGEMCNAGVAPCVIKEVFFPPDAPHEIATLIESAIVYQNTGYFEQAIDCFDKARLGWREHLQA